MSTRFGPYTDNSLSRFFENEDFENDEFQNQLFEDEDFEDEGFDGEEFEDEGIEGEDEMRGRRRSRVAVRRPARRGAVRFLGPPRRRRFFQAKRNPFMKFRKFPRFPRFPKFPNVPRRFPLTTGGVNVWPGPLADPTAPPAEPKPPNSAPPPPRDAGPSGSSSPTSQPEPSSQPEGDRNGQGSEHVRWVQSALNNVLGLNLNVDGIMDVQTRSAVRSFQTKKGLPADGIVGPPTERALMEASASSSQPAKPDEPAATAEPAPAGEPSPGREASQGAEPGPGGAPEASGELWEYAPGLSFPQTECEGECGCANCQQQVSREYSAPARYLHDEFDPEIFGYELEVPAGNNGQPANSRIIDLTGRARKSLRKAMRDPKKVYALVLHQMACCFKVKNPLTRFLERFAPHFAILPDGRILQLHPVQALTAASNGFNSFSVAVEFAGNFPNVQGKWWFDKKATPAQRKANMNHVTPAQIEAGRWLVGYLKDTIGLRMIVAHRQSSATRENDPGPDIWYHVGQWAIDKLGLSDGGAGYKVGTGNPIPDLWRKWGVAKPQPELEIDSFSEAADPVERFIGSEHRDIGDLASGREATTIVYGESGQRLTYGEVVALAGDYFETYDEMRDLALTKTGRAKIAWARWDALSLKKQKVPEPQVTVEIKDAVRERYYFLASRNLPHFSAGGTGWQAYTLWHGKAINDAFDAGQKGDDSVWRRALTKEAFGHHFLTDIFSAGHVRTPRAAMRTWYQTHMPDSTDRFLRYMSKFMYDRLNSNERLPPLAWWFSWITKGTIKGRVTKLGGEAVNTFSLGDIVALALHDLDNRGLKVVSEVDPDGKKIPGGHRWTAMGDAHLGSNAAGATTKKMAMNAVIASLRELERVRGMGRKLAGRSLEGWQRADAVKKALGTPLFAAKAFVPKEDFTPGANTPLPAGRAKSPLEWRWGQLGNIAYQVVDVTVKLSIADALFDRLRDVPDPVSASLGVTVHGTRHAFRQFIEHLRKDGIRVLEMAVGKKAR